MSSPTINTQPTVELHEQIVDRYRADPIAFERLFESTNDRLAELGASFECSRRITTAISAFLIDDESERRLGQVAEKLHTLVEKLLSWTMENEEFRQRTFADHARFFPFLQKSMGSETWQNYSRYDAVVTPSGDIKIIELNTGCPAGFTLMENVDLAAGEALSNLLKSERPDASSETSVSSRPVVQALLEIERRSRIDPALVVLANDENQLMQELQPLSAVFGELDREAVVADAGKMTYRNGQLCLSGRPISMTVNKMRLSTVDSPGHHWSTGFEQRYADFLRAQLEPSVVSLNNLCAMTIGEDKGLLDVLTRPEVFSRFDRDEQAFIEHHLAPTARIAADNTRQLEEIVENRERYVLKPANEGRGLYVSVGPFCDDRAWREAVALTSSFPFVAQRFENPLTLPVVCRGENREMTIQPMYVTFGLAIVRGTYRGLVSRISSSPVTNVAQHGMLQATFRTTS